MPEPNLPPLRLYDSSDPGCDRVGSLDVNEYRSSMPELPEATRQRLMQEYSINLKTASLYVVSEVGSHCWFSSLILGLVYNSICEKKSEEQFHPLIFILLVNAHSILFLLVIVLLKLLFYDYDNCERLC